MPRASSTPGSISPTSPDRQPSRVSTAPPARVQAGDGPRPGRCPGPGSPSVRCSTSHTSHRGEGVDRRPAPRPGAPARRGASPSPVGRPEDLADLEQGHALGAVRLVVGDRLEQPRPQRGAQHRLLGRQRVGDGDRRRRQAGPLEVARAPGTAAAWPRRCPARPGPGATRRRSRWWSVSEPVCTDVGTRLGMRL